MHTYPFNTQQKDILHQSLRSIATFTTVADVISSRIQTRPNSQSERPSPIQLLRPPLAETPTPRPQNTAPCLSCAPPSAHDAAGARSDANPAHNHIPKTPPLRGCGSTHLYIFDTQIWSHLCCYERRINCRSATARGAIVVGSLWCKILDITTRVL